MHVRGRRSAPFTMIRCDPHFEPLLGGFERAQLDEASASVYGLWPDSRLAYLNSGWFQFAEANGGEPRISRDWGLGANALLAIDPPLRGFFEQAFRACGESGATWNHRYECSSAQRYREFHMHVYPLGPWEGFLVVNSLVVDVDHDPDLRPAHAAEVRAYTDEHDLIVQCIHCRRIRCVGEPNRWDWVPAWVERPPENTSGSLCSPCYEFHFGGAKPPPACPGRKVC